MKVLYFVFYLFSLLVIKNRPEEITVISYNIRYDNPDDGENQWSLRKEKVASYLRETQPDIVGMQEVLQHQLEYLNDVLDKFSYVGVGRDDGKTKGEYSPILYNSMNLKVEESNTFWLSETPEEISVGWDAALERICTYARFKDLTSGKQFWVFNTHFDHIGELARAASARLILRKIEKLNKMNIPVVITGDFNLTPDTEPIKILQNSFEDVLKDREH